MSAAVPEQPPATRSRAKKAVAAVAAEVEPTDASAPPAAPAKKAAAKKAPAKKAAPKADQE